MSISIDELLDTIVSEKRKYEPEFDLDQEQREAIQHDNGPLWILAGPGTGKTEVLALRCVRHLLVDELPARSIIVTTFTRRAASQLKARVSHYLRIVREKYLTEVNESELRIGTLHSLCQDVLMERRYERFLNFRLIDEIQQRMFVYENSSLVNKAEKGYDDPHFEKDFWLHFEWVNPTGYKNPGGPSADKFPSKRWRAKTATALFNKLVEFDVDLEDFKQKGEYNAHLVEAVEEYRKQSAEAFVCDQSLIQVYFLDFIRSPQGEAFLKGDNGSDTNPGIKRLLVDEYQDTNPIQEKIYFNMATAIGGNICVVGDDDQALYRFRGSTVECMTLFGERAKQRITNGIEVRPKQILNNYRSHPDIVEWLNHFINSHPTMMQKGARALGKKDLVASSTVQGNWTAVARIMPEKSLRLVGPERSEIADKAAELISDLIKEGKVKKKDICILCKSTKTESDDSFPAQMVAALNARGIDVYNPRSKTYHEDANIMLLFGAIFTILDAGRITADVIEQRSYRDTYDYVEECKLTYQRFASTPEGHPLRSYVEKSIFSIRGQWDPDNSLVVQSRTEKSTESRRCTLRDLCSHILNYEPFTTLAENDPNSATALVTVTKLIEQYASMPSIDNPRKNRDLLMIDRDHAGEVSRHDVRRIYQTFLDIICTEGYDEEGEEEVQIPEDSIPMLTIHAAKGLQFPIVFVYTDRASIHLKPGVAHRTEEEFGGYLGYGGSDLPSAVDRANQDLVRELYVAYSRAQHALVMLETRKQGIPQAHGYLDPQGRNYVAFIETIYGGRK